MKINHKTDVRIIALLLTAFLLFPLLVACKKGDGEVTTDPEITTEAPPVQEPVTLDIGAYTIIRESDSSDAYKECAKKLRTEIEARTGIKPGIDEDFVYPGHEITPTAKEILVGNTNRPETAKYLEGIRDKDFVITFENERVIIAGGSAEATMRAVEYFLENYVNSEKKDITVYTNRVDVVRHDYAVGAVTLNGVPLSGYALIYADGELLAKYAAENLAAALLDATGVSLSVASDKTEATANELLIGNTNRAESAAYSNVAIGAGEYLLSAEGGKIVMLGNGYMVGGGASALLWNGIMSGERGADVKVEITKSEAPEKFEFRTARSAILMIGDGMGRNHIEAAKLEGMSEFYADSLPNVGTCQTYSYSVKPLASASYTDSAAAATALATGYKTINGYIGIDHLRRTHQNVRELAYEKGAKTAVVTTDVITGATPAGFTAHCSSRSSTEEIQTQIDELIKLGQIDWCEGSVGNALTKNEQSALNLISADGSAFFMMLEEAYIDKNSHKNKYPEMVSAVKRYNDAIAYAIEFVLMHPDTVLIITADHETGGVTKASNGKYEFTKTTHTNTDVPLFAMGAGTEVLTDGVCNNVNIAKFIAAIFGDSNFGSQDVK